MSIQRINSFLSTHARLIVRVVVLVIALIPLIAILRYAVDVPKEDVWRLVGHYAEGNLLELRLGLFWPLTNEHRSFLREIFATAVLHLTNGSMLAFIAISYITVLIMGGLLLLIQRRTSGDHAVLLAAIPVAAALFTLGYWPRWIDPRAFFVHLPIIFLLAAIYTIVAQPKTIRTALLAAMWSTIGSLTFFTGNLIWPVILPLMWVYGYREIKHYAAYVVPGFVVFLTYIYGWPRSSSPSRTLGLETNVFDVAVYALATTTAPLKALGVQTSLFTAVTVGTLLVAIILLLSFAMARTVSDGLKQVAPSLCITGWILASLVFAGIGRLNIAPSIQIIDEPRYRIYGMLIAALIGLVGAIVLSTAHSVSEENINLRWPSNVSIGAVAAVVILMLGITSNTLLSGDIRSASVNRQTTLECVQHYVTAEEDCIRSTLLDRSALEAIMPSLVRRGASFVGPEAAEQLNLRRDALPFDEALIEGQAQRMTIRVEGVRYEALQLGPSSSLAWVVTIPEGDEAFIGSGMFEYQESSSLAIEVAIVDAAGQEALLFRQVGTPSLPNEADYIPIELNLSDYAGQQVTLIIRTADADQAASPFYIGLPKLYYRE